ncbi:MAG: ATP synthase F0 subunit B [Desulfobacterales bacterium]|nr:ATP synthase F0 subunit B [Desulfobacterales bacterium]
MLSVDYTVFIQIFNFLLLLTILNIFLFKPIRGILTKRNEETNSLKGKIDGFNSQSDKYEEDIENSKVQARKEGHLERENCKGEGLEEEKKLVQDAISSAEGKVGAAKKDLEQKMADVRKSLEGQIAAFSNELAEKVLGRSIQ